MSWPVQALLGPGLWALAFAGIYSLHGVGCAWGWPARPAPLGDLQSFTLISLWLIALTGAALILWRSPERKGISGDIVKAGGWIGLVSTALTLFPVLGLSGCELTAGITGIE